MKNRGPTQHHVSRAGDEKCRRKAVQVRIDRRQDRIFQIRRTHILFQSIVCQAAYSDGWTSRPSYTAIENPHPPHGRNHPDRQRFPKHREAASPVDAIVRKLPESAWRPLKFHTCQCWKACKFSTTLCKRPPCRRRRREKDVPAQSDRVRPQLWSAPDWRLELTPPASLHLQQNRRHADRSKRGRHFVSASSMG